MSDLADDAQENIEHALYLAQLARQRQRQLPTGKCLECGEITPGSFCCPECRDHYELREKLRGISGQH